MDLDSLLRHAVDGGASDVHLKVGQPPILRHDGALQPAEGWLPLTDRQLEEVLATVTAHDSARRATFDQTGDLDLAYTPPGLPRLRVNGFRQRGSISFAFRVIPSEVPGFAALGLPEGIELLADEPLSVLCNGATGSGKTTTSDDHRAHQRHAPVPHRHDRGSRSCTTTGSGSSTSARSAWTRPRSMRRSVGRCARTPT